MSDYVVSARKYRPDSFGTLIGQDNIVRSLKNSISRGQLAHAYLFCGPRGVGKTSTARIFAKTINCAAPGKDLEPCGKCDSCTAFQEGRSFNIRELDAASNNSVEDIRNLLEQVQIPPQVGRYSVYIIDEVHMLSTQAFNAFLKTLEEPPAHAIFILCTTEKHKILPTILSRCQTYDFNRITIPDMMANLRKVADAEGVKIDDESLQVIAAKADGAMRDALTLFDQSVAFCGNDIHYADVIRNLGVLDHDYSFSLTEDFLAGDYAKALLLFDEILGKGFNALHFLGAVGEHLRDLLVARTGGLDALLDQTEAMKERYRQQGGRCSLKFLYEALGIIGDCEAGYKASSNRRLHIEYALMRLCFLNKSVSEVQAGASVSKSGQNVRRPESPAPAAQAEKPAAGQKAAADAEKTPEDKSASIKAEAPEPAAKPAAAGAEAPAEKPASAEVPTPGEKGQESPSAESAPKELSAPPAKQEETAPEGPAAAPAPRRRGSASAKMASLMGAGTVKTEPEGNAAEAAPERVPEDEEILSRWPELVNKVASARPRLQSTLGDAVLRLGEDGGFKLLTFEVMNSSQKAWIEEKILRDLEKEYNALLGTARLHLAVGVRPSEEVEEKKYMPHEQAQDLMDRNSEVKNLVKDLALDTK